MRKLSAVIGMIAIALYASADVRNIRPPITGEGKLGTTTYKWGEVNAVDGYYSNLILGGLNITNKFLSPYDGEAGEVFYANGLGGGVWGAASSPTNGISLAVAESMFATAAQGAKADAALPKDGSEPMAGDLDFDGYDITDARVVDAEVISMDNGRTLIGGKTISSVAGTTTRQLIVTNSVLYIAGDINSAYWATNDYVVVLSASLATNYYKINSIDQCAVAGEPISTLGVGDYYLTCDFSDGDVPEEAALTACGVVALEFRSNNTYRGFTFSYQAGFGSFAAGEYCNIGVGHLRNGIYGGILTPVHQHYVRGKILGGDDDGHYAKIIFHSILEGPTGYDVSINYSSTYSGTSSYNPTVSVFPNH